MPLKDAKFGDILAFDGDGLVSNLINVVSGGNVSHTAFVINEKKLIESTMLDDSNDNGVYIKSIDEKIESYDGDVWHLSTKKPIIDIETCYAYALDLVGTPYDMVQAAMSALDILMDNVEDFNAFYCTELCGAIMKKGKTLPKRVNVSEITPVDLCRIKLYNWHKCVKGEGVIKRFNTINVKDFNEY